jgi:hypothetical protein
MVVINTCNSLTTSLMSKAGDLYRLAYKSHRDHFVQQLGIRLLQQSQMVLCVVETI